MKAFLAGLTLSGCVVSSLTEQPKSVSNLFCREWTLRYEMVNGRKEIVQNIKKYSFSLEGVFGEIDGENSAEGKWFMNSDSSRFCWVYTRYNDKSSFLNQSCSDFRYNIESLSTDTLKLSILGREGTAHLVFSGEKKK